MPLSEAELSLVGTPSKPRSPMLGDSLDFASRRNPDEFAEAKKLEIDDGVFNRNKSEVKRLDFLSKAKPELMQESHPKTSQWLSNRDNAAVAIDDLEILKGMEDTLKEPERGFWNNAGRGGLETVNNLTGNLIEFVGNVTDDFDDYVVRTTGLPNPGIVFGEDGMSWSWDVDPKLTGIEELGKSISKGGGYDYKPDFTWEKLKGDVTPSNLAGYIVEQGVSSLPHMAAAIYTLPAYILSRTEAIAEERVKNDERDDVTGSDLAKSVVPATITALMEKLGAKVTFGLGKAVGVKGVAKATGAAAAVEGGTEFIQEGIEYLGETVGTKKDVSVSEMLDRQFAGLVAGSGMGATIRGATSTYEAVRNKTKKRIIEEGRSGSEQQTLDKIITYAQSSTTNGRASAQYQDFVNSLGSERSVLIPQDVAMEMNDAPKYIIDQINDLGTSVSIPMDKFAAEIAPNQEWMALFRPHIKLSESALSQTEMTDKSEIDTLMEKALNEKESLNEADEIFNTVKDQLVETGMQADITASKSAQLFPAIANYFSDNAKKLGEELSVTEAFEMMGFRVERGDPDITTDDQVILDQAKEAGYEGDVVAEANEYKQAADKGLDMSQEARMQRAKEQGYLGYDNKDLESLAYTVDRISDLDRETGEYYGEKASQDGFNQASKFSQHLSVKKIPHKKHVAKSGTVYITILGDPYPTRVGGVSLSEVEFRFSDHSKDAFSKVFFNKETDDSYKADIFPGGHSLEYAIEQIDEMKGVRSIDAAFDQDYIYSSNILAQQDIPADLQIEMESEVIETGETITESFNAKELSDDINAKLESYQKLKDCLN